MSGDEVKDGVLTIQMLKSMSNEFDIESIHTISLTKLGLTNIAAIGGCIGLERLDLSYNDINQVQFLAPLANLLVLNLSANRVTALHGLQALDKLEKLDLAGNLIGNVDGLRPLVPIKSLRHLRMSDLLKDISNPMCMRKGYKMEVLRLLPQLDHLEGEIVKGPNAEVFSMLAEIEREIDGKSSPLRDGPVKTATPPQDIPQDLLVLPRSEGITPTLTESQFRSVAAESEALNIRSADLIAQAEKRLRQNEVV